MKKFRLPRKIKKQLKKILFIYRHDQGGLAFIMASPTLYQEFYNDYKQGKLTSVLNVYEEQELKKKLVQYESKKSY